MKPFIAALLAAAALAPTAQANLVTNGSFEDPALDLVLTDGLNPVLYRYGRIDPALLTGWSVSGSGLGLVDGVPGGWVAGAGDQYINLESGFVGAINQTVATTPGQRYTFSFLYAPDPFANGNDDALRVFWDGQLLDTVDGTDVTLEDLTWHLISYEVTATAAGTVLGFEDTPGTSFVGAYLDDVQLAPAPVPLPGAALLFGSGLLALGLRRRA